MKRSNQRLELQWVGKGDRPKVEPRLLLEESEKSYTAPSRRSDGDLFGNMLIHGDNLLALKALDPRQIGPVDCIFIDPPYNTGAAFQQYDDGLEHSLWLSMIAERVRLLHMLLAGTGSMWITVDDSEAHYLKVVADEIFGRTNFVANVVWQKKYTVANDAKWFSDNHDHILVYAKNKPTWRPNKVPRSDEMNARYSNPDDHPKGPWKATPLHAKSGSEKGKGFQFKFSNGYMWSPPPGTFPRFSEETLRRLDSGNEIWFGRDGRSQPSRKTFLSELTNDGTPPLTVWLHEEVGHNHEAKTEAKAFNSEDVFDTPKPERLLQRIIHLATKPGDLVLDSFAGSGTTGAVAHKMKRRWIMIEMGNQCDTHIVPRLHKVIDGADLGGVTDSTGWKGGGGFRYYQVAPSLLEADRWGRWIISKKYNAAMLAEAMCKHMGFTYAPSQDAAEYWRHGYSSESDFIYVTTSSLTQAQLKAISLDVGSDRTLLICCKAFNARLDALENLTVRKIPHTMLARCEWGRDDYSLRIASLPNREEIEAASEDGAEPIPTRRTRRGKPESEEPSLFPIEMKN
ncbi:MAG: site-specific DNA-methyltransferase [Reyranella sp.]